jgi:hypothetical protein
MALYRHSLPQLDGAPFLADGSLETSLVFLDGVELPARPPASARCDHLPLPKVSAGW